MDDVLQMCTSTTRTGEHPPGLVRGFAALSLERCSEYVQEGDKQVVWGSTTVLRTTLTAYAPSRSDEELLLSEPSDSGDLGERSDDVRL